MKYYCNHARCWYVVMITSHIFSSIRNQICSFEFGYTHVLKYHPVVCCKKKHVLIYFLCFYLFSVQIGIFYSIFYAALAALVALCMWVFFQTLDPRIPKWKLRESIIGTNPGKIPISKISPESRDIQFWLNTKILQNRSRFPTNATTSKCWKYIDLV